MIKNLSSLKHLDELLFIFIVLFQLYFLLTAKHHIRMGSSTSSRLRFRKLKHDKKFSTLENLYEYATWQQTFAWPMHAMRSLDQCRISLKFCKILKNQAISLKDAEELFQISCNIFSYPKLLFWLNTFSLSFSKPKNNIIYIEMTKKYLQRQNLW